MRPLSKVGTMVVAAVTTIVAFPGTATAVPKPHKISKDVLVFDGGAPVTGPFNQLKVSWPTPDPLDNVVKEVLTCANASKTKPTLLPSPIVATVDHLDTSPTFAVTGSGGGSIADYSNDTTTTSIILHMPSVGGGVVTPPLSCKVDVTNNLGGTAVGKAPKVPASASPDCRQLPQPTQVPPGTNAKGQLELHLATGITDFADYLFCSTDDNYHARWLNDQAADFNPKVKAKKLLKKDNSDHQFAVTVKKLGLSAPVSTQLTLSISGSDLVYSYDPTHMTAIACTPSAAKNPGTTFGGNFCDISTAGQIHVFGDDQTTVKPGKPIVSPTIQVDFVTDSSTPTGLHGINFVSASSTITVGTSVVQVHLQSLPRNIQAQLDGGSIAALAAAPFSQTTPGDGTTGTDPDPTLFLSDPNAATFVASFTTT